MKYTTHKLPTADLDPNSASSGQKFGEAGQVLALERGESVEALRNEQDSSTPMVSPTSLIHQQVPLITRRPSVLRIVWRKHPATRMKRNPKIQRGALIGDGKNKTKKF
jgi:hypothetical protein